MSSACIVLSDDLPTLKPTPAHPKAEAITLALQRNLVTWRGEAPHLTR